MVLSSVLEDTHLVSLTRHSCLRWIFSTLSPGILSNYLPCCSYPVFEVWGIQGQGFRNAQGLISFPWLLCVSTTHPPGCYCCHKFTMVFPHPGGCKAGIKHPGPMEEKGTHISLFSGGGTMPASAQAALYKMNTPSPFSKSKSPSLLQLFNFIHFSCRSLASPRLCLVKGLAMGTALPSFQDFLLP